MKKIKINGKIKDKFIIKHKITRQVVHETKGLQCTLSIFRYPAFFNSEEDAKKYIDLVADSNEEKDICSIEAANDLLKQGGFLIIKKEDTDKIRYNLINKSNYKIYTIDECSEKEIISIMKELKHKEENTEIPEGYKRARISHLIENEDVNEYNWDLWCNYFGYEIHLVN